MKKCQHCENLFEDDIHEDHEYICAKNPSQQEKTRQANSIEGATKNIVLMDGRIRRMYWKHSGLGDIEIDVDEMTACWEKVFPNERYSYTHPEFLKARGFNIINTSA